MRESTYTPPPEPEQLDVALVTWPNHPSRIEYFRKTVAALRSKLTAPGYRLHFVCSSETQRDPKHPWFGDELEEACKEYRVALVYRDGPASLGANMNAALRLCVTELLFLVQDDWLLLDDCNLSPGADYMRDHAEVDYIRYSWPGDLPTFVDYADGWRRIDWAGLWPYGDDPQLRRKSFPDKFGWYIEGGRHGVSEGAMVHSVSAKRATILAADKCYFGHCGEVASVIDEYRPRAVSR